jgi:hypothetical protein
MAIEEGLGQCPVCDLKIEVGQPARYFKGVGKFAHAGAMAHNSCVTAYETKVKSPEYKRQQAEAKVAQYEAALAACVAHLDAARTELEALSD